MKKGTLIIGLGGAGCKIVSRIKDNDVNRLLIDWSDEVVEKSSGTYETEASYDIINLGNLSSAESKNIIFNKIKDFGEIILVNPAGGYMTGSTTISLVDLAKKNNKKVKLFTSVPFDFEGKERKERALDMISYVENMCEVVKVEVKIDRPMKLKEAFSLYDEVFLNEIDKIV